MNHKAIGLTCGIGSMLEGARQAGFEVILNIEWRNYYRKKDEYGRNTFLDNFKGAKLYEKKEQMTEEEFKRFSEPAIAYGHPECGSYSQLNANKTMLSDPGDIPLFVNLVRSFKPRFFVMDDLPKSLDIAFPMKSYADGLPDYDLFPEWVSNWGYGNVQKQRNRFFMIGARKSERWAFIPGEERHSKTVADIIGDLNDISEGNYPNHDRHTLEYVCAKGKHLRYHGHEATWEEMRDYVINEMRCGAPIKYFGPNGESMTRVGSYKGHWDGPAHVLTGGISGFHPLKGLPYTIRERARLQGFPDDFIFYGTNLIEENGRMVWNHDHNMHMVKQTGKAMPIQFCRYVGEQVIAHLDRVPFTTSRARVIPANTYVSNAKRWYCMHVGYANQERACGVCWMRDDCDIRRRILGGQARIVEPDVVGRSRDRDVGEHTPGSVERSRPAFTKESLGAAGSPDAADAVLEYDRERRGFGRVRPKSGVKIGKFLMTLIMMDQYTTDQIVAIAKENYPSSKCSASDVSMARRRIREAGGTPPNIRK